MGFEEKYVPGEQPDPAFKAWFAKEWRELHEAVTIPGMAHASWDRKAAYLLWDYAHSQRGFYEWCAEVLKPVLRGAPFANVGTIRTELDPVEVAQMVDEYTANKLWGVERPVNPAFDWTSGKPDKGIPLVFDAMKW